MLMEYPLANGRFGTTLASFKGNMDTIKALEEKVERLERTVQALEAQVDDLDMCYAMLLKVIEREVEAGNLKLDIACFEN